MATFLVSCLSLVALSIIAEAMRTKMNDFENISRDEAVIKRVPQFSFKLFKTPCAELDFGNMKGIIQAHPKAFERMQSQGTHLSNKFNCRLCDLEGDEFNLQSPVTNGVVVKCHAYSVDLTWKGNLETACLSGNGKPGWRSKENVCLPCPNECEQCLNEGGAKWFKCILPYVDDPTPVPAPWKCRSVKERKKHPQQFQWCKYRKDLVNTSTNAYDSEPNSRWELALTASRCDKTEYEGFDPQIATIIKAITPKLDKLSEENCELCRIMFGASKASSFDNDITDGQSKSEFGASTASSFDYDITVGQAKTDLDRWVDTKCAFDEFGLQACRADRGKIGWANVLKCAPCPPECHSCEDSTKTFKCNLRYRHGPAGKMTEFMLGVSENQSIPEPPKGYDCETPTKKTGKKGTGIYLGGYKTHCKYRKLSY